MHGLPLRVARASAGARPGRAGLLRRAAAHRGAATPEAKPRLGGFPLGPRATPSGVPLGQRPASTSAVSEHGAAAPARPGELMGAAPGRAGSCAPGRAAWSSSPTATSRRLRVPADGGSRGGDRLLRGQRDAYRVQWPGGGIEFHPSQPAAAQRPSLPLAAFRWSASGICPRQAGAHRCGGRRHRRSTRQTCAVPSVVGNMAMSPYDHASWGVPLRPGWYTFAGTFHTSPVLVSTITAAPTPDSVYGTARR